VSWIEWWDEALNVWALMLCSFWTSGVDGVARDGVFVGVWTVINSFGLGRWDLCVRREVAQSRVFCGPLVIAALSDVSMADSVSDAVAGVTLVGSPFCVE